MGEFMVDRSMRKGVTLDGVKRGEANRSRLVVSAGKPEPGDFR